MSALFKRKHDKMTGRNQEQTKKENPSYEAENLKDFDQDEPGEWEKYKGEEKIFYIAGEQVKVSSELDTCIMYRESFQTAARFYADRFKFRFSQYVHDFDSFLRNWPNLFLEGATPMSKRAYSLLLPFGVFDVDYDVFWNGYLNRFKSTFLESKKLAKVVSEKNRAAKDLGNAASNAIRLTGGGFGMKGAMKGIAQAEAFNLGMNVLGKMVESGGKTTQEEKNALWEEFDKENFFDCVYNDYYGSFKSFVQCLSDKGVVEASTLMTDKDKTMYENLKNPMFPEEHFIPTAVGMIQNNPFEESYYDLLEERIGQIEEFKELKNYFLG